MQWHQVKVWRWLRRLFLALLALWLVLLSWQAPVIQSSQVAPQAIQGVWLTNIGAALMYYTTRLDDVVANLAKHRLNTLYPAVWNRGETLHPSPVMQRAGGAKRNPLTTPPIPGQDVLRGLVHQAHRQHLRVIPWFEYGLMLPINAAIAKQHPDWLTVNRQGKTSTTKSTQGWLNPAHPEVQQFITDLIVDVVKRYAVDGIQLDDHFGLPIEFGYDPYTIRLYRQTHNGKAPPQNPADPAWMAWRATQLTRLLGKITTAVKATRATAIVSLSPNLPDFAYQNYLQDWTRWVNQGLLDEVVVQIYRQDLKTLKAELRLPQLQALRQKVAIAIGLYTGPFLAVKKLGQLQQEVEAVQAANYKGVSFFCWETTLWIFKGGSQAQVQQTFQKLFANLNHKPK